MLNLFDLDSVDESVIGDGISFDKKDIARIGVSCKRNRKYCIGSFGGTLVSQPEIRNFVLDVVFEILMKKSAVITKTDTIAWKIQSCKAVKKTCSKSSKTTISKTCLLLPAMKAEPIC